MPVVAHTGARVAPGDALFTSPVATAHDDGGAGDAVDVLPGEGCVVQYVEVSAEGSGTAVHRCIVATRQGVAQWDGRLISVFAPTASASHAFPSSSSPTANGVAAATADATTITRATSAKAAVMGPRPGDTVHLRVTRLTRLFAFGEIIAVNWRWCSHRSGSAASMGIFKGVLRVEDIRTFRPTKDQLQPPPPTLAFAAGDVVLAEVISQSDAHQYQLSTVAESCGVVESFVSTTEEEAYGGQSRVKLQHIPGRRDAMVVPSSGHVVPRWCPLLP